MRKNEEWPDKVKKLLAKKNIRSIPKLLGLVAAVTDETSLTAAILIFELIQDYLEQKNQDQ